MQDLAPDSRQVLGPAMQDEGRAAKITGPGSAALARGTSSSLPRTPCPSPGGGGWGRDAGRDEPDRPPPASSLLFPVKRHIYICGLRDLPEVLIGGDNGCGPVCDRGTCDEHIEGIHFDAEPCKPCGDIACYLG